MLQRCLEWYTPKWYKLAGYCHGNEIWDKYWL